MHYLVLLALAAASSTATPPASHVAFGFNFDELRYIDTARNKKVIQFHNGHYDDPYGDLPSTIDIEDVIPGRLSGAAVAIVVQRGEGPGGYDEWADVFQIVGRSVKSLGTIGSFDFLNTGEGPQPDTWSAFRFRNNRLYADIWNREKACDRRHDWVATTYEWRSGKLVAVNKLLHHRANAPIPKPFKNGESIDCRY